MATRLLILSMTCLLVEAAPCGAALYEFTLEGVVQFSFLPEVSVGDPASLKFIVDDQDLEPSPTFGKYTASGPATIAFPKTTLVAGDELGFLQVKLIDAEIVQYQNIGPSLSFDMGFAFPDGTITTDALPLTLPLSLATTNSFYIFPIFHEVVRGRITSYTGVPIPEPAWPGVSALLTFAFGRRTHRAQSRCGGVDAFRAMVLKGSSRVLSLIS